MLAHWNRLWHATTRSTHGHLRGAVLLLCMTFVVSFVAGAFFNRNGIVVWDDIDRMESSQLVLATYGLLHGPVFVQYYPYLWELVLGIGMYFLFPFLHDPILVRHALTFALFPTMLLGSGLMLVRGGVRKSTAFLAIACIFGIIRLGGHAAINVKDVPAALVYMFSAISIWVLAQSACTSRRKTPQLVLIGALSVLPFALRPPLALYPIVTGALLLVLAMQSKRTSLGAQWSFVVVPAIAGAATLMLTYPTTWQMFRGDIGILADVGATFGKYFVILDTRMFGMTFPSNAIPWWYSLAWIPVISHPLVLVSCGLGLLSLAFVPQQIGHSWEIQCAGRTFRCSLTRWLWVVASCTFLGIIFAHPNLYDEERHILFAFGPLFLLGALGLDWLSNRAKIILGLCIVAVSIAAYTHWGQYSYVYKNPLIGNIHADRFMNDYWGVCFAKGMRELAHTVPQGMTVALTEPSFIPSALIQDRRLRESLVGRLPGYGTYTWVWDAPEQRPYAILDFNRFGKASARIQKIESTGIGRVLWTERMPPGDLACTLTLFE